MLETIQSHLKAKNCLVIGTLVQTNLKGKVISCVTMKRLGLLKKYNYSRTECKNHNLFQMKWPKLIPFGATPTIAQIRGYPQTPNPPTQTCTPPALYSTLTLTKHVVQGYEMLTICFYKVCIIKEQAFRQKSHNICCILTSQSVQLKTNVTFTINAKPCRMLLFNLFLVSLMNSHSWIRLFIVAPARCVQNGRD